MEEDIIIDGFVSTTRALFETSLPLIEYFLIFFVLGFGFFMVLKFLNKIPKGIFRK